MVRLTTNIVEPPSDTKLLVQLLPGTIPTFTVVPSIEGHASLNCTPVHCTTYYRFINLCCHPPPATTILWTGYRDYWYRNPWEYCKRQIRLAMRRPMASCTTSVRRRCDMIRFPKESVHPCSISIVKKSRKIFEGFVHVFILGWT